MDYSNDLIRAPYGNRIKAFDQSSLSTQVQESKHGFSVQNLTLNTSEEH